MLLEEEDFKCLQVEQLKAPSPSMDDIPIYLVKMRVSSL